MRISRESTLVAVGTLLLGWGAATASQQPERILEFVNPPEVAEPGAYTHLVQARGGRTLYVAGQVALDRDRNLVGPGDMRAQATQVFRNVRDVLAAGGATFDDVVKMTMYVVDMSDLAALREVRAQLLGDAKPANTLVQVVRLAREDFLIEVEAVAVVAD